MYSFLFLVQISGPLFSMGHIVGAGEREREAFGAGGNVFGHGAWGNVSGQSSKSQC